MAEVFRATPAEPLAGSLRSRKLCTTGEIIQLIAALVGECQARVQEAVERFETFAAQAPQALFEHVYARWPAVLEEQREQLLERAARRRGGAEHE